MTDTVEVSKPALTELGKLIATVGTNPAKLQFPTDKWGFTTKLKKEILLAASNVRGQDDKHDLLIGTLAILITHIKARKDSDRDIQAKARAEKIAAAEERKPREQYSGPRTQVDKPSK